MGRRAEAEAGEVEVEQGAAHRRHRRRGAREGRGDMVEVCLLVPALPLQRTLNLRHWLSPVLPWLKLQPLVGACLHEFGRASCHLSCQS